MPPIAPDIPLIPTTEPTAFTGNRSECSVYIFAEKPWCPAAAKPITIAAGHSPEILYNTAIGSTRQAHVSIADLRATEVETPRRISMDESHPPNTLPASEIA